MKKHPSHLEARATIVGILAVLGLAVVGNLAIEATPTAITPLPAPVQVNTNGVLVSPANFFATNGVITSSATNAFAPATGSTNYAPITGSTNYAPQTRTINGHPLTNNVALVPSDLPGLAPAATNSAAYDTNGAAAAAQAYASNRTNQVGTQPASTITGLAPGATNSAAYAPISGSTNYVAGSTNAYGSVTVPTYGTVGDFIPKPQQTVLVPSIAMHNGPQAGNVVCYGDSLTQGIGVVNTTAGAAYVGYAVSYPSHLAVMPFCQGMNVFNLGLSGQTTATGNSQYAGSSVDSTITTNGTTTATVTGSTSGVPSSGYLASQDIALGTTYTLSGTTLTLSVAATGSHTSKAASFEASPTSYIGGGYLGRAHWLSPAITGQSFALFLDKYGKNDYYVGDITSSGTATNGGATITSMTINTGESVGSAALTGTVGYNVFGCVGTANGILLGTVSSATSTSITLNTGALVTAAMNTFKLCPQPTAWETQYSQTVNKALADGYFVGVESMEPAYNSGNYSAGQFEENRLLYNAWLYSTYANGATTGCIFIDVADIPAFQTNSTVYYPVSQGGLHLNENGYALEANVVNTQLINQISAQLTNFTVPFSRFGLNPGWLPQVAARTDQATAFTGGDVTIGQNVGYSRNLNVYGNFNIIGSTNNGNALPYAAINDTGGNHADLYLQIAGITIGHLSASGGGLTIENPTSPYNMSFTYGFNVNNGGNVTMGPYGTGGFVGGNANTANTWAYWNGSKFLTSGTTVLGNVTQGEGVANATASVTNTTTETTLVPALTGNVTIPASSLVVGAHYRLHATGVINNTGTPTLELKAKLGSTVIADTTAITTVAVSGNNVWTFDDDFTCQSTGSSGTIYAQGEFGYYSAAMKNFAQAGNSATTTINTTASQALALTATWGTASASNTITCTNLTLERVY